MSRGAPTRSSPGAPAESAWRRWVEQPQRTRLRRVLFQVHLWSGLGLGLYVFFISVTGSVLVYRNELYAAATRPAAATPGGGSAPSQVGPGFHMVSRLIELHDDLLAGPTGRMVNGAGAVALLLVALSGLVVWWPGRRRWRRSLAIRRDVNWPRLTWDVHSALGFWSCGVVLMFAVSGVYLCAPGTFHDLADWWDPPTAATAGRRLVDHLLYWMAYLHFGRMDGIGLPCSGPGLCDQATKAAWAVVGLAPAALFVTGAIMWWYRVIRPR